MDETEWLRSADACRMLDHLYPMRGPDTGHEYTRKLRLYLAALGRAVWTELPPAGRALIELAEHLADRNPAAVALLPRAEEIAERLIEVFDKPNRIVECEEDLRALGFPPPDVPTRRYSSAQWVRLCRLTYLTVWAGFPQYRTWIQPSDHRADLVRDVFGNPFRGLPRVEPDWRTADVTGLVATIYEGRNFSALPVLADALEEAGCMDRQILDHCREERATHVRGCWVVDLLRGIG